MSFEIDKALVQTYKRNIEVKYQQMGSRIRPYCRKETQTAEFDFFDRVGPTDAVEVTTRHGDTPLISTPHDRRRVGLRDFDWADMIDRKDKLRMLADPSSSYTVNAVAALGRKMDDVLIEAAFGTAYTGKTGATTVTLPSSQTLAVNYVESGSPANSNLTTTKLRRARYLMDKAEATTEGQYDLVCVLDPSQIFGLLGTTQVQSSDYNSIKALVNGDIDTWMGFRFVKSNRLPVSGTTRSVLIFEREGLLFSSGMEVVVDVGPRRDKRNSIQVYVCGSFGAARMWEDKVIKVLCDESTAA
jgi:hypothetical protein